MENTKKITTDELLAIIQEYTQREFDKSGADQELFYPFSLGTLRGFLLVAISDEEATILYNNYKLLFDN